MCLPRDYPIVVAMVGVALLGSCRTPTPAELVLKGGAVYTVNPEAPWATALAISDGRILYVGDDSGAAELIGSDTEVIELGGKMVLPGFVDAHSHPASAPVPSLSVSLYGSRSLEDYVAAVSEYANAHPGREVIEGAGWSNTLFPESGPSREALDAVVSDRPVVLSSEDGHSTWVNSKAFELAGITDATEDPEGGVIVRDPATGRPSGTLRESAADLVAGIVPERSVEEHRLALEVFAKMAASAGVTTVRDAYVTETSAVPDAYLAAALPVRVRANVLIGPESSVSQLERLDAMRARYASSRFAIDGVKLFIDGVVEGETAYLLDDYTHRPGYRGELLWEPEHLNAIVTSADRHGFMVHAHAIGDGAVRVMLDAFAAAREENGERDARHQMTHLQLVHPDDVLRFGSLDIIAVPQPFWFTKGAYYDTLELPFLGEARANSEYPMRSFFDHGGVVASASDFPVTIPFDPLLGIEMGVLRTDTPGNSELVLGPDERATLEDMVRSFTIHGARASFVDDVTGSLEPGKLADIVVLGRNLFEIDPAEISETEVLMTVFEGAVVHRAEGF